jgi:hypothetical protein
MYFIKNRTLVLLGITLSAIAAYSQKVEVGYDKSADFSRLTTYSWVETTAAPARPFLYQSVVRQVDYNLESKGLKRVAADADLVLVPTGGVGYGLSGAAGYPYIAIGAGPPPVINSTMWTGATGFSTAASWVAEGSLQLEFVERSTNKIVWSGSVEQKLDTSNPEKSLDRVGKAITKLLKQFPPKPK